MDTSEVSLEKRPYIPLILEAILECPVLRDGKLIPYETVVSELEMDTIAVSTRVGIENTSRFSCGAYSHNAIFALQVNVTIIIYLKKKYYFNISIFEFAYCL